MKTILKKWSNVGIAVFIVLVNFLFVIRVGLAYGPYDWVRYMGQYGTGAYGPYGTYGFYTGTVMLVAGLYPVIPYQPSTGPTPYACIVAPIPFDPPDGKSSATRNAVLRWRSDYDLKSDEVFDVLVWTDGSNDQTSIGTTRDKTFPLDMVKWQFNGIFGKFFWTVRIKGLDGIYRSCPGQPFSFTLTGLPNPPPAAPVPPVCVPGYKVKCP